MPTSWCVVYSASTYTVHGMCGVLQLQQLMTDKKKGLPEAHRGGIIEEMARLKKELLENGVKPVGLKLITNDPELKDLLS